MATGSLSAPDPGFRFRSWRRRRSAGPGLRLLIMMARRLGGARNSDGTPGPVLDSPLRLGAPGVYSPLGTRHKLGVFTNDRPSFWDGAGALLSRDIPV